MLPIVPYKRIIIFSSFVSVLKIFECILNVRQSDILTLKYTGKQNRSEREKTQEIFTNPSETRPMVLLASLGAGSCGLNLTPCSTIFLADIAMNPYDQLQAINRVHRLTQQNRVNVYKFCMKDMIEEKIIMSHNRKFGEAKESGLLLLD
jgi:non-specific serine/threonine protein kinase